MTEPELSKEELERRIIQLEKENNKLIKVTKPDKISFDKKVFKTSGKLNYPARKTGIFGVGKL